MNAERMTPLAGLTVVDLTELLPGPYATLLLRQMGATVIKVEKPGGDAARVVSPGMFRALNTGKECIEVNLKLQAGLERMQEIVRDADVLIEGFRPGVLQRLGLAPERLLALNPRLVVVSLTGYGQEGPMRDLPGHDINYAALAGLAAISGTRDDSPSYDSGLPIADMAASMFTVNAVLGALLDRQRTGLGCHLDVAITDCVLHWMTPRVGARQNVPHMDAVEFQRHLHARPGYGLFRAGCGRWLAIGALETSFWKRLVEALDLKSFSDPRFDSFTFRCERKRDIEQTLQARFATQDRPYWLRALVASDVPATAVNDIDEGLSDPHFLARGLPGTEDLVRFPVVRIPAR